MKLVFDVFGTKMSVHRQGEQWLLYKESATSMRVRVYDVVIPSELMANELARFLDDIYHEHATEQHSDVHQLD